MTRNSRQDTDYGYFSHDADMGIIGWGRTVTDAFVSAAESTFAMMADLKKIKLDQSVKVEFNETAIDYAFVTWLNLLLAEARANNLMFAKFALQRKGDHWVGEAWGEPWTQDLEHGIEVKGATLTSLSVKQIDGIWEARCIVDV